MNMLRQHREAQALQEQSWMNSRRKDKGKERERHSYYPESNHGLQSNSAGGDGSFVGKATKAVTAVADYFLATPPPDVVDDANHTHSHPSKSTPHQSGYQSHHNIRDSDHHSRSKSTKKDKPLKSDREVAARIQVLQDEEYALQLQQDILAQERQDAEYAASLQRDFDNERIRLLDDETMMRNYGRQETFDCCICMETHPEDSVAKVEPCGHKFCRPCIQSYVSSKIRENVFPIVCPLCATGKSKNKGAITGDFIEIIGVSEEDYIKYSQLALTQFSILLECRKCGKSVNVDKDDLRAASIITCPVPGCRGMWCRECSQFVDDADGANHSCDGTKELDRLLMQKGWRRCPGCTTPVEKTAGCDHMTCGVRTCGTHFSWSTGRRM
ncbi:hypothetical protein FRC03_000230 [Tulasnella sp. 419]|nr:hypothetical protein FRC03_000230 [Tulasnella sp. 419]